MAKETTIARESETRPLNAISGRTRAFARATDGDWRQAVARRGDNLLRQYAGYRGLYQTAETISETESRNRRRINRAVNNMII